MVLALDPGTSETAYVFMNKHGEIGSFGLTSNIEMIGIIKLESTFTNLVIEEVRCYGMAVGKDVFETIKWTGRFWEIAAQRSIPVDWIGRKEVMMHWCGSAKAKDSNLNIALQDFYGGKGNKKAPGPMYGLNGHTRSALALAGYWYARYYQKEENKINA